MQKMLECDRRKRHRLVTIPQELTTISRGMVKPKNV